MAYVFSNVNKNGAISKLELLLPFLFLNYFLNYPRIYLKPIRKYLPSL
jgi:hypothetical protein